MRKRYTQLAAFAAALAAALVGCGDGDDASGSKAVTVYLSLPLSGLAAADGRDAADGARLALADADGEAGGVTVAARFLDAGAPGGGWSPARSAANARTATRDSTAIAYVGDFQAGATRASLPITNQAFMLQVSPASGAGDLVAEFPGSDEISELQTTNERTFGRVIPSDEQQAAAAAAWARELAQRRVKSISDGSAFGDAALAAFNEVHPDAGLRAGGADLIYYGGYAERQPPPLTQGEWLLMISDAGLPPTAPRGARTQPQGTLATSAALDPSHLPSAGQEFAGRFEDEHGRPPGRYAAYGYEAMALVLDSIERADDPADRQAVVDAFLETADRDSILGQYSITEEGETTLGQMSGYELRHGEMKPIAELEVP